MKRVVASWAWVAWRTFSWEVTRKIVQCVCMYVRTRLYWYAPLCVVALTYNNRARDEEAEGESSGEKVGGVRANS